MELNSRFEAELEFVSLYLILANKPVWHNVEEVKSMARNFSEQIKQNPKKLNIATGGLVVFHHEGLIHATVSECMAGSRPWIGDELLPVIEELYEEHGLQVEPNEFIQDNSEACYMVQMCLESLGHVSKLKKGVVLQELKSIKGHPTQKQFKTPHFYFDIQPDGLLTYWDCLSFK